MRIEENLMWMHMILSMPWTVGEGKAQEVDRWRCMRLGQVTTSDFLPAKI